MRGFKTSNRVDKSVRSSVKHLYESIRLGSKEESVPVQINGKMIKVPFLQSRKWNALKELERGRGLCVKENGNGEE